MSGAGWVSKHDVYTDGELVECKTTEAISYSLKLELLETLEREALLSGKWPVLDIKFEPRGKRPRRYVILTEDDYLALRERATNYPQVPDHCTETQWCDEHKAFGVHFAAGA